MSNQHKGKTSKKTREAIVGFVRELDNVAWTKDEVIYPQELVEVISGLPVFYDGFLCKWEGEDGTACPDAYICRTIRGIQEHCKEEHKWANCQKRGGNSRAKCRETVNKIWVADQDCQRFFVQGEWQRYFRVVQRREGTAQGFDPVIKRGEAELDRRVKEIKEAREKREMEGNTNRFIANPWLEFTGCEEHVRKCVRQELIDSTQPAIREEPEEQRGRRGRQRQRHRSPDRLAER